jgi:hypothetical protein
VANSGSANLSTFINQGNGTFGGHVDIPTPCSRLTWRRRTWTATWTSTSR